MKFMALFGKKIENPIQTTSSCSGKNKNNNIKNLQDEQNISSLETKGDNRVKAD
jgi:hypothetical protein